MQQLQHDLAYNFDIALPGIELRDDTLLIIAFDDTKLTLMKNSEQEEHAQTVAQFVRKRFPGYNSITMLEIAYLRANANADSTNGARTLLHLSRFTKAQVDRFGP